jgi:ATP-dependent Clp protease ATP-binding subunit ClpC
VLRTEHVLTALLRERGGVAAHVLRELSLDEQRILATLQAASQPGSVPTSLDRIGVDPGVRDALTFASEEARAHGRELIGTGHLLVGLMREKMGVAAQVLSTVHLEPERVRALVIQCLRRIEDDPIWDLIG